MRYQAIAESTTLRASLCWLAAAAISLGCGEKGPRDTARRPGVDPAPEAQAPRDISGSFIVEPNASSEATSRAKIAIARDAVGKEFLLQSGITTMPYLGTSQGNLSRIVTFRLIDGALWMFEATDGLAATRDIPQTFVLAKFPILRRSATHIYFDFNAGMSDLIVGEEWRASDFSGTDVKYSAQAIKTSLSYLESASINDKNELVIRQIAQVDLPVGQINTDSDDESDSNRIDYAQDHSTIEVRYYLTPYAPDPNFVPTVSPGFSDFGFFEVAPRYDAEGNSLVHASKFGNGPITFAISANTPVEVRDAVRDGILYWNKILGAGRLQVVEAPAGINAPDFNHNIVQWVNWDTAGFAYADAQADPRTGQILHAQVYMTSVFWVSGKSAAKTWLERVAANNGTGIATANQRSSRRTVGLRGFQGGHLCLSDSTDQFQQLLTRLVSDNASDAQIQKIASDYVRETVAHEIGHTLGLRHNFAGSLAANFPLSDLDATFTAYAESGVASPDKLTTSSVMEYQTFLNSTMTGDQLVSRPKALPYDEQAISKLYSSQLPTDSTLYPFCTDSAESQYADCKTFDEGASVPDSLVRDFKAATRLLSKMSPTNSDPSAPSVPLVYLMDADVVADTLLDPLKGAAELSSSKTRLFGVRHAAGLPASLEPQLRQAERDKLFQDITAAGGFDALLPLQPPLPDPGSPELAPAKANLESRVTAKLIDVLATPEGIADHAVGAAYASHLGKMTRLVALTDGSAPLVITTSNADGSPRTLTLPTFKYSVDLRAKAAALLKPGRGESPAFALDENLSAKAELLTKLNSALGEDITTVEINNLSPDVRRWVVENRAVLDGFGR